MRELKFMFLNWRTTSNGISVRCRPTLRNGGPSGPETMLTSGLGAGIAIISLAIDDRCGKKIELSVTCWDRMLNLVWRWVDASSMTIGAVTFLVLKLVEIVNAWSLDKWRIRRNMSGGGCSSQSVILRDRVSELRRFEICFAIHQIKLGIKTESKH